MIEVIGFLMIGAALAIIAMGLPTDTYHVTNWMQRTDPWAFGMIGRLSYLVFVGIFISVVVTWLIMGVACVLAFPYFAARWAAKYALSRPDYV